MWKWHVSEWNSHEFLQEHMLERNFNTHEYDLYTQSVIFTRIVWFWHIWVWLRHSLVWFWHEWLCVRNARLWVRQVWFRHPRVFFEHDACVKSTRTSTLKIHQKYSFSPNSTRFNAKNYFIFIFSLKKSIFCEKLIFFKFFILIIFSKVNGKPEYSRKHETFKM
jgi:hypothetical protein